MTRQALSCSAGMLLLASSLACGAQQVSLPTVPSISASSAIPASAPALTPVPAAEPSAASSSSLANVPERIPYKRDTSLETDVARTTLGLLLCFGALAAVLAVLRKRNGKNGFLQPLKATSPFAVLYSRRLGARASLHAIEFEGERFLIAQSGDRITRLASSMDTGTLPRPDREARD